MQGRIALVGLVSVLVLAGCAGPSRLSAVPSAHTAEAVVPGLEGVRYRQGIDEPRLVRDSVAAFERERAVLEASGQRGPLPPAVFLAVSGGGDDGAFAAGLLNGWTDSGTRPVFKLVTGVSTGALIAPFAFLGSDYDDRLRRFYTTVSPDDIIRPRSILSAITDDAMADSAPLRALVARAVDRPLLDAIAQEYEKGRLLLIATVDLDARQSILWNMTELATRSDPRALELFRSIMIASAAIPGAFPPVMIDVRVGEESYQEMHVDGGTMSQVFVYPTSMHLRKISAEHHVERERRVYVIRNARLDPDWAEVERSTMSIAARAISALIQTQGIGDLYRIHDEAERDGVDFNLAYIPASFDHPHPEDFDTEYMRALYRMAYDLAVEGYPWAKRPPDF